MKSTALVGAFSERNVSARAPRLKATQFQDCFDSLLWRPKSSGREKARHWVMGLLRPVVNMQREGIVACRKAFYEALLNEDIMNPAHPNVRAPNDCRTTPYAYRLWPDKVQALVAFDAVAPSPSTPDVVRTGRYQPVGMHTPRLTAVKVSEALSGGYEISFAETEDKLKVYNLADRSMQFSRRRDKNASVLRKNGVAKLHQLRDLCAEDNVAEALSLYIETIRVPLRPELADPLPVASLEA